MIKTILVATDASKHAENAVALASDLARRYGARLVIVHAVLRDATGKTLRKLAKRKELTKNQLHLLDHYEVEEQVAVAAAGGMAIAPNMVRPPQELLQAVGVQVLGRAAQKARDASVKKISEVLLESDPADGILETVKREKADLVVLGTRGLGEIKGLLLGSVSHKIAARAPCPVLTVK